MFTTKICAIASRLHKMGFIRNYLAKFKWLEFDKEESAEKMKVTKNPDWQIDAPFSKEIATMEP